MVTGSLIVEEGAQATVSGMVQGIHVLPGGTVSLRGTCMGNVKNEGRLIVSGTIRGHIQSTPDADTVVEDGAIVGRGW